MLFGKIKVQGGTPLKGTIVAAGAKNAMTKLLVASLLSNKRSIFYNVPNILDVAITLDLCKEIGASIAWDQEKKILEIQTEELHTSYIPQRFSGANRIPILMIGALLKRTKEEIIVPTLGGDFLGSRPLNYHIHALQQLGATIEYRKMKKEGAYLAHAHQGLKGAVIDLPYPSVGATENALLASLAAEGVSYVKNAALEPEILDLIQYLQKMGAVISLEPDRTLRIEQLKTCKEVVHEVLPDRNEIVSYASLAISTNGKIFIKKARHADLLSFLAKIRQIGGDFVVNEEGIEFFSSGKLKGGVHIETQVHPGFMTDWQPPFGVLLTQCEGSSIIHETVYENRFVYMKTLQEMGAKIESFNECLGQKCRFANMNHCHSIIIHGPTPLRSQTEISIPDLRAGFAYVMAALLNPEPTIIHGSYFLERGYEHLEEKLSHLGANFSVIEKPSQELTKKELSGSFTKFVTSEKEFSTQES